jgi:hypothetical protein
VSRRRTAGALLAASLLALPGLARAQWDDEEYAPDEPGRHVRLTLWGGGSSPLDRGGGTSGWMGGELGWIFSESSLSGLFELHRFPALDASRTWTPVALARFEQRFETRRGLEGTLTLGLGAGKPDRSWISWYQFTVGIRLHRGPFFLGGEAGFERDTFFRFGAGAGVSF